MIPSMKTLTRRHPYISFTLCSILCLFPFMRMMLPAGDEGVFIYDAVRIAQGQVPYREFFEMAGPGTFCWVALFFKVFGITWLATRLALMVTSVATAFMMFFLARRLRTGFDVLPAIFLLATLFGHMWPTISNHGDSNLLALLSFAAFIMWLDNRRPVLLVGAGALTAVTTCVLQPKGILLFLAFLLLLWLVCRRDSAFLSYVAWLATGYFAIAACVLLLFGAAGGLHGLVYANIIWPLTNYSQINSVPYGFGLGEFYWEPWTTSLSAAFSPAFGYAISGALVIPFLVVLALPILLPLLAACRGSQAFSRELLPYWIAGWALWLSEIHRKDITHLVYGSPLLVILLLRLVNQFGHAFTRKAIKLTALAAIALAVFNACLTLTAQTKTTTVRGSVYMFKRDPILDFLNTHVKPGEEMFVYSYSPMYYFLSGTNNPTRYSILMYQMNTDSQFLDVARSLKAGNFRYVVWDNVMDNKKIPTFFPGYHPPPKGERVVEQYLTRHFDVVYSNNGIRVLERQDSVQTGQVVAAGVEPGPIPTNNAIARSPVARAQ
jgi:hypothetical protein